MAEQRLSDILSPPLLRLTSRKPLCLDLQPVDIKSRWRHNWKSAQVVNSHLVCDSTIQQPGFDLCPLTKLNGGLSRLHSADEDAVSWLTSYGSWHAYEKKKKIGQTTSHSRSFERSHLGTACVNPIVTMYLLPFLNIQSSSSNGVILKTGLGVVQGHLK